MNNLLTLNMCVDFYFNVWYTYIRKEEIYLKIFCDFDDTLFKSSKRVIDIINSRYGLCKTESDLHDWRYRSIHKGITDKEVISIYDSEDFFVGLEEMNGAIDVINGHEVIICTKGTRGNIVNKKKFVKENMPYVSGFITANDGKERFDMSGCVQIDDRYDNLSRTNALVKILFKNFNDFEWQKCEVNSDIYVVNTWEEINQILKFLEVG